MLANFSDYAADNPKLSFEEIAKESSAWISVKPRMETCGKKCREVFEIIWFHF